ncbi:hypothetical protein Zm00014a_033330 [Zea mays]|uniref:Uncharacterized protein n=1 Tax=Zea mays TaxID=4577 RepID=A0A3L6FJX5_MAIZE|nr:hypothetical protein Zm00014a_033330 [Zea mays]
MVNDEQLPLQWAEVAMVPPNQHPWGRTKTIPRHPPAPVARGCGREAALHHQQWDDCCPPMENAEVHILHLHTAFRDLLHRWKCYSLSSGERLQHGIINNV